MYQVGQLIFYGSTGVCKVKDITALDMKNTEKGREYYVLEPYYQKGVIYTPVDSKVFMRPIISKSEAEELIDAIPTVNAQAFHCKALKELSGHYEEALKTHDCARLIELTMSIHEKKRELEGQKRKFGAVDEQFMKRAEEQLFGELAAALEIEREKVRDYIDCRLGREGSVN